jgi:aminomethyltransferase
LPEFLHPNAEVFVRKSSVTVLGGEDALAHLDRCLTASLVDLENLDRRDALLCDANGRIQDRITICVLDNQIIVLGSEKSGTSTRETLLRGIGWDDDVSFLEGDNAISHLSLIGQNIHRVLVGLGIDCSELSPSCWIEFGNSLLTSSMTNSVETVDVALPKSELRGFLGILQDNGCHEIPTDKWDAMRMLIGITEIEDLIGNLPFEVGVGELVKLDNGCYPGQEVHARLDSRGRLARRLVRLVSANEFVLGRHKVEGIGTLYVTSTSSNNDTNVAYALVPSAACELDELTISSDRVVGLESLIQN